jgi:hypothetical protein
VKWKSHASISPYFSSKGHFGHGHLPQIYPETTSVSLKACSAAQLAPSLDEWHGEGASGVSGVSGAEVVMGSDGKWWEVMGSDGKWWEDWKTFQNHQTCPKVEKLAVVFPTFGRNNYRWASKFEGPARWRIGGVGTWLPNN